MFDIDDFKLCNDYYGHSVGDKCLIEVANTVRNNLRESDWIARWGGDEFIKKDKSTSPMATEIKNI